MSTKENHNLFVMGRIVNVRDYEQQSIDEILLTELLTAFSLGPSLANIQPWEVVILQSEEEKQRAINASLDPFMTNDSHGAQGWIKDAPLVMIACLEKRRSLARLGEKGEIFSIQDLFAAIQNFRLMATIHGLGTSVVREFDNDRMRESLELPWYVEPLAIVTAGYSNTELELPPRLQVQDFVHWGRFV
jgi:5,6-dimethylbenzimidazole synthase